MKLKYVFSIILIILLAIFGYKAYVAKHNTVEVPQTQNKGVPVFAWKTEDDTEMNLDGLPKTKVSLEARYAAGTIENKFIDNPSGSCNELDEVEEDTLAGTKILQCYAAGLGYKYKIIKGENSYIVQRQEFEEGSPEYNPPVQTYETITEFPL